MPQRKLSQDKPADANFHAKHHNSPSKLAGAMLVPHYSKRGELRKPEAV
jgi:hypothetical protein